MRLRYFSWAADSFLPEITLEQKVDNHVGLSIWNGTSGWIIGGGWALPQLTVDWIMYNVMHVLQTYFTVHTKAATHTHTHTHLHLVLHTWHLMFILCWFVWFNCCTSRWLRNTVWFRRWIYCCICGFCWGSNRREVYCSGFCMFRLRCHSQNEPLWFSLLFSLPPAFCFYFSV